MNFATLLVGLTLTLNPLSSISNSKYINPNNLSTQITDTNVNKREISSLKSSNPSRINRLTNINTNVNTYSPSPSRVRKPNVNVNISMLTRPWGDPLLRQENVNVNRPANNPSWAIYWDSQPKEVRELETLCTRTDLNAFDGMDLRKGLGVELALKGFTIDLPIMVWCWDPGQTMSLRRQAGYTWVPSILQDPVGVAPGLIVPGLPSYNPAAPPEGSIIVKEVTVENYPPFDKPAIIPNPPAKPLVCQQVYGEVYSVCPGVELPADGTLVTDPRGTFRFVVVPTAIGKSVYFRKVVQ